MGQGIINRFSNQFHMCHVTETSNDWLGDGGVVLIFLPVLVIIVYDQVDCTGDVPPPRSGQAVCTYHDCVFLFGGMDSENEAIYNDLYSLNTGDSSSFYLPCFVNMMSSECIFS